MKVLVVSLLIFGAAVVHAKPNTAVVNVNSQAAGRSVQGRTFSDMISQVMSWFGFGDDYDYYDNYIENFDNDQVSSYTHYDPFPARNDEYYQVSDDDEYSWGEFALDAAMALIPLGILIAALPSGLFTVAVKRRSFEDNNVLDKIDPTELPLLRSLQESDFMSLTTAPCQRKLFCELSQLGKHDEASLLQKAFYYISNLTPDSLARPMRLQRLFVAVRENECHRFSCRPLIAPALADLPSNHLETPSLTKDPDVQ